MRCCWRSNPRLGIFRRLRHPFSTRILLAPGPSGDRSNLQRERKVQPTSKYSIWQKTPQVPICGTRMTRPPHERICSVFQLFPAMPSGEKHPSPPLERLERRQHIRIAVGDRDGMLEVCRRASIRRHHGPMVRKLARVRFAGVDHRLDANHHAGP